MYYDRVPALELRALLLPGGALRWLIDAAHAHAGMHVQLRRSRGERGRGSVQLYLGRTSPLEVISSREGRVQLSADKRYRALDPALFEDDRALRELEELRPRLEAFVGRVVKTAAAALTGGEAIAQSALLRRYGPFARPGDPFVALDSEVVIGFDTKVERTKADDALLAALGLSQVHRELDAIGVLEDGAIALVELKALGGDLDTAVAQVATHRHRFGSLHFGWERRGLGALGDAKAAVGLLPFAPRVSSPPRLVPVIAAPDLPSSWRPRRPDLAAGVRLWRLDEHGQIEEERHL